jgi:hypothetical protein
MALLACLCCFQHLFAGLTNRSLRELIAGLIPGYSPRQMTYDLAACAANTSSSAPPHPAIRTDQRGTSTGRLSHQDLHADRQPPPSPTSTQRLPPGIAERTPLAKTWRAFERAIQDTINDAAITRPEKMTRS